MKNLIKPLAIFAVAISILLGMNLLGLRIGPASVPRDTVPGSAPGRPETYQPGRKPQNEGGLFTANAPVRNVRSSPSFASLFETELDGTHGELAKSQPSQRGFQGEREIEARPDQPDEALQWRMLQLVDENGFIPHNALINAWEQGRQIPMDSSAWPAIPQNQKREQDDQDNKLSVDLATIQPTAWTWLGPGNVGGRIRSIIIHPNDPQTMWVGSVGGGIWKTTNGGTTWSPQNDFMANVVVSCMAIDPANPSVLYAGTGEGFFNLDALRGAGIFKTTDGGTTWTQLSSTTSSSWYYVNRLAINPGNSQIVLAATNSGIWRSTDGGSTWSNRTSTSVLDIDFNPSDGSKSLASGNSGALFSVDGGLTWSSATGLPSGVRVEAAYSRANPAIVYASVDRNDGQVYRSTDGGHTFALRNTGTNYFNAGAGGQGWYDNIIWIDPTNSSTLIVGGIDLWRSTDSGSTFTKISEWSSSPQSAHGDQHAIIESPQFNGTNNKTVFFGNDGGIYKATDVYNVAQTSGWTELNNNLGITQFYGGAGNTTSGRIFGGAQDNGTLRYIGGTETWDAPFGGDGGWCASDPTDSNYFFGEYVFLRIHRNTNGGASPSRYIYTGLTDAEQKRTNFIAPFILDPNNANTLLAGGDQLWRSTNVKAATPSWSPIKSSVFSNISAIAVAKGNSNIVWVGHNNGNVYYTTNGTASSPTWTRADLGSPTLPDRYCTRVTIDPTNSGRVYVTFGGFSSGNVWRTDNNGATWTNITGNLPSAPVRTLAVWQQNASNLYVGTEVGIFASANGGQSWSPSNDGPTNCSVEELFWMNNTLVAVTHGRGMFSINITGGGGCTYSLTPANQSFAPSGGNGSFGVTTSSGCAWSAMSNATWITTSSSGSGSGTVNFVVSSNSGVARTGTISVGGQTFTVNQSAGGGGCPSTTINLAQTINGTLTTSDCFFTGTTQYVDVYHFSGTAAQQIAITMNSSAFDTYLYLLDSGSELVSEDDDGGGGTNSRIPTGAGFFTLPATGTYTIYATSYSPSSTGAYSITLSSGSNCTYSLSPTSQIFIASASTGSFNVSTGSNCSWTAISNASWITTTSSGTGNGTVSYSVATNTGNARTGLISVGVQTFSVFQSAGNGNGCPVAILALGQTINTTLTSGCVFTGTSRYVDPYDFTGTVGQQIVVTMSSSAFDTYLFLNDTNNQTIAQDDDGGGGTNSRIPPFAGVFTLPATGTYRIFATSFSSDGTSGSTGPYTISLSSAPSCSYSLSSATQSFGAAGGSNSFNIFSPVGCTWTALSNASWITTSSSGSGNGTINYSVAANTGAARTGTISVGGQLFTVTQSVGVQNYTIAVSASPTVGGTVSGEGTFAAGTSRTVTAAANVGYTFTNWTENGGIVSLLASYIFTLNANRNLVANFTNINYTITVSASPVAGGTVNGGGVFGVGSSRTVTATVNGGYSFTNWSENGNVVSTSASYNFTLSGNRNLVANFTPNSSGIWSNVVGVIPSGNSLTKTAADGWGNGGASASGNFSSGDGYVEFTATETNKDRMCGLSNGDNNQNYPEIRFAIDLTPGGVAWVFESGVGRGVYTLYQGGDVFRIAVEGGVVKYRKNGTLFHTSNVAPVYPLLVDTSLYSTGATITNVVISGGNSPTVTTTAASLTTTTSATLNGSANPNGFATTAWFEWGTDPTLTSNTQTSAQGIGSGTSSQAMSSNLSGLTAGTNYYFRAVASNSAGQTKGSIQTFFTGDIQLFWTNVVGVAVSPSANSLVKTAADGWGNGGARSIATINSGDGYAEFTATETNKDRMAGLGTGDSSQHYSDIEYAVDLTPGGVAWVFESGVGRGVYSLYQAGDVFRVAVEGGVVKYRRNGTLFYTSNVAPVYPLLVDTSLYSTGATITNVVISGNPPPGTAPAVTTTASTSITNTSATLNGSVNPNGLATTAWFEWGTDPTLTSNTQTSAQAIGSGTSSQAISANLSGLTTNTNYYFRAVASNSGGQTKGSIQSFLTGGPQLFWTNLVGVAVSPSANSLSKTAPDGWGNGGARSIATINSGDGYAEFTATETNKDRMAGLGTGDSNQNYADIEYAVDLTPGGVAWVFESGVGRGVYTLYQAGDVFRIAVEGGAVKYRKNGTLFYTSNVIPVYPLLLDTSLYSTGATITNAVISGGGGPSPTPPTVSTTAATSITSTSATLNGGVNPNGLATNAYFEWGTDPTLTSNTQTSAQGMGSGTSSQALSANLSGLTTNTIYYFRAVASNSAGQNRGSILSFSFSGGGPSIESVVWTEALGVLVSGNNLTKTAGDGWGNAGASSSKGIVSGDGYIEFTATETNKDRMAGLSNGDTNKEFADIDFAINLTPGGIAWVFESGVSRGVYTNYQVGDVFRIAVEGGVVRYRKNGTLFYTSNVAPVYPLVLDTSLYSNGATITTAVISGNLQSLVPTLENVVWTNVVGANAAGNNLTKTAADGWGNAGAVSSRVIPAGDGYVQFTATETNRDRMAGLSKGDSNQHYADIDYAVNLTPGGTAWVFESGVSKGVYTLYQAGDVFRVGVEGGVVKYSKNGSVFYTSTVAPAYPLLLDTSLSSTQATVTNAVIFGKF